MKVKNKELILEKIKELELQESSKKININEITNIIQNKNIKSKQKLKTEKVKDYRKQAEYGEKKFIKP